jgi:hypothetical protein
MVFLSFVAFSLLTSVSDTDTATFAKLISEKTKTPAMIVTADPIKVKCDVTESDLEAFLEPSRRQGFTYLRSDIAVGSVPGIPYNKRGVLNGLTPSQRSTVEKMSLPAGTIKNALVSFATPANKAVTVSTLAELKWSKPLLVDAYYVTGNGQDFPVSFVGKDVAETDFLKALARGLGGKYKNNEKSFTIAFDPVIFRKEAFKLIALADKGAQKGGQLGGSASSDPYSYAAPSISTNKETIRAGLALLNTVIAQLPDGLIEQTFGFPNTTTRLNLNIFKGLQPSIITYIRTVENSNKATTTAGASVNRADARTVAAVAGLVNRVSPNNPGNLTITTDFRITLELNTTNSSNPVTLSVL